MIFLYPLFYYGAYIFFVIMINSLIVKRGYAKLYTSFFLFIYVVGMLPASHILYFLIINRSLVFTGIQSAYREFDPGNIPGSFFSLFKSTGGLWGGVWAILMLLFFFFFFISIDLKTKNGLLDIFAVTFPFSLAISKLACFSGGCCH